MSKYGSRKKQDYALSEEVATEQITMLLDYYDIDPSRITNEEQASQLERMLDHLRDLVRSGTVDITRDAKEKVIVTQTLTSGDVVTYGELTARAKLAMDKVPENERYRRIYALMGSLSGIGSAAIEKYPVKDLATVELLGAVFSNA